jgi:hypothetical protein
MQLKMDSNALKKEGDGQQGGGKPKKDKASGSGGGPGGHKHTGGAPPLPEWPPAGSLGSSESHVQDTYTHASSECNRAMLGRVDKECAVGMLARSHVHLVYF